ncbi:MULTISPECIES: type II toxin-antitoxin system RelB family antitoxin [Acinetobacter]|uniref:type II toxin-antitoxin system RelB family antitoxin n=1 Tax=Acinetobacter TaxID=469 RepID=UPI000E58631D|nr:antitoxin [Acinetobacter haemolyticus]EHU3264303.1 antitoxin [Acinetobacter baumannii]NAR78599.1 antitoxin [Acinetobacter haemolyticus]NAR88736.1 antitoxin [Acinetobacter haemolyticus]NAR94288.1 antitoxin [Acinetobacter haemolyticus]QDJ91071.1 antitoxin [Acinetobacter haemolyticus]
MKKVFESQTSELENSAQYSEYNVWFKAKIEKSMADTRPTIPHDKVIARLKKRRKKE